MIAHRSTRTRPGVTRTIKAVSSSMSVSPPTISATPRREARIWISLISSRSAMVSNVGGRDKYICDPLSPSGRLEMPLAGGRLASPWRPPGSSSRCLASASPPPASWRRGSAWTRSSHWPSWSSAPSSSSCRSRDFRTMNELFITDAALPRGVYRVFRLPPAHAEKANVLLSDDLVSRQSVTVRDARVEHERFQAVNDQSPWTTFIEERGRRGVDVLQPAWIGGPGRSDRGDAKDLPALRGSLWPFGRQPEERRVRLREEPEERGDAIVGVEREIAQAPPERWGDSTPPFCMCRRAAVNAHFTP